MGTRLWRGRGCRWTRRRLSAWADGALPGALSEGVAAHLRRCEACGQRAEELLALRQVLRNAPLPPPPAAPTLWGRIEAALERGQQASVQPAVRAARSRGTAGRVAWGVVAGTAAAVLVWVWVRGPEGPPMVPGGSAGTPIVLDVGRYAAELASGTEPLAFWQAYRAETRRPGKPVEGLPFEPVWRPVLPGGYRLVQVVVLQEACCKALQLRYRSDGQWLDVFQRPGSHPVRFGDAILEHREVAGASCLAANWPARGLVARSFVQDGVNVVVVGHVGTAVADAIVEALRGG